MSIVFDCDLDTGVPHLMNDNENCRLVASPENVTEITALISYPKQDQFYLLAPLRCRFSRCGVGQPLGRDATPVRHPARMTETPCLELSL